MDVHFRPEGIDGAAGEAGKGLGGLSFARQRAAWAAPSRSALERANLDASTEFQ